jgi:hypothetical protein
VSTSTAVSAPGIARFAMVLALQSMCLWLPAMGGYAGDAVSPRFEGFSVRDHDRSAVSADLWKFVSAQLRGEFRDGQLEKMRDDFKFTAIGPDAFLVMGSGIYLARPHRGVFELVTPAWHADAIDLPIFRPLRGGGTWAFIRVDAVRHGERETDMGALFVGGDPTGTDKPSVRYETIGTFSNADDQACDSQDGVAQHVDDVSIRDLNKDSLDDIVVSTSDLDCQSRDTRTAYRVFINTGKDFEEPKPEVVLARSP